MPFALNLIYPAALVIFSPLLFYRWLRIGEIPRRLGRETARKGTVADRGTTMLVVPCGQCG